VCEEKGDILAGISYKGIYAIHINDKPYVGKDSNIFQSNRLTNHLNYLRKGTHNNRAMQNDYDEFGEKSLTYTILCFNKDYTEEDLRVLEQEYVKKLDSFNNGYNDTLGGVGMWGYKHTPEQLERRSISMTGENNPTSKLTNDEFYQIVDLFKKGYTNDEIADLYNIHTRYISLIRHKRRFKRLWEDINFTPMESPKGKENRKISYETYTKIMSMFENGATNADVQRKYSLSGGTGSRLRHGKLYKDFFNKYKEEKKVN
jgi:hypothetical protein